MPFEGEKIERPPTEETPLEREAALASEKEKAYRELIDNAGEAHHWFKDVARMSWPEFEGYLESGAGELEAQEEMLKARELYLEFQRDEEPLTKFLIEQMDKDLEEDKDYDFYKKLTIFQELSPAQSGEALTKWLENEKIWNNSDRSCVGRVLGEFPEKVGGEGIPALENYIRNISQPGYRRREIRADLYDSDVYSAVRTLLKIEGEQGMERLRGLAQENHTFFEWHNTHRPILENLVEERVAVPSPERAPREPLNYEEERIFLDVWKKRIERRKEQQEEARLEPQQILIRGSALMAQMLGKDKKLVRDIDVFLVGGDPSRQEHCTGRSGVCRY